MDCPDFVIGPSIADEIVTGSSCQIAVSGVAAAACSEALRRLG